MVPANDAQEPEPTAPQITAGNKPPTASSDSTARLTPMPAWLMHWWTPLAIAEGLLRWPLLLAFFWGGQPHWPSSKAMKLCLTITGAGLAFSAWQQRSHDNAIREEERTKAQQQFEQDLREREQQRIEKREQYENEREQREEKIRLEQRRYEVEREERERNRLEQIQREEYWRRREQAYNLLSSPNASIRLGAIELLTELANTTTESSRQPTVENQQFIQHITTALCAQIRREGLNIATEGTQEEHALIQSEIIDRLIKIANQSSEDSEANAWPTIRFNLSQTTFYTPIQLKGIRLKQELDFSNSSFLESFQIEDSTLDSLKWDGAELMSQTIISKCKLRFNTFPSYMKCAHFSKTTFLTTPRNIGDTEIILPINSQITSDESTEQILFKDDCTFQHKLKIHGYTLARPSAISFKNCTFGPLEITGRLRSLITLEDCLLQDVVNIHDIDYEMGHSSTPPESSLETYDRWGYEDNELQRWCVQFPDFNPHQETNISINQCVFTNSTIVGSTILTNIRCYHPYSEESEDFVYDEDVITFTGNRLNSSTDLSLQCINQHANYESGYSFEIVEVQRRNQEATN